MDTTENEDKRQFREKGSWDLNAVTDLVSTADGCRAQDKKFLIWQEEEDGNLGKMEKNDNLGKVEGDGNLGKVEGDGSLGMDNLKMHKGVTMAKHWKNAYYYLICHQTA